MPSRYSERLLDLRIAKRYTLTVIKSFVHKGLEKFFRTGSKAGIQAQHAPRLRLQLAMLDEAVVPLDMNAPGWRLHPSTGRIQRLLVHNCQRQLASHVQISRGRRRAGGLSGLSLNQKGLEMTMHNPPHPGELVREYLGEVSVSAAAKHLGVGRVTLSRVINGKAAVSPEMAVRLAAAFGTSSPEVWLQLQAKYDLWQLQKSKKIRVGLLSRLQHS